MLGRNSFTQDEIDHARAARSSGFAAYKALAGAARHRQEGHGGARHASSRCSSTTTWRWPSTATSSIAFDR